MEGGCHLGEKEEAHPRRTRDPGQGSQRNRRRQKEATRPGNPRKNRRDGAKANRTRNRERDPTGEGAGDQVEVDGLGGQRVGVEVRKVLIRGYPG